MDEVTELFNFKFKIETPRKINGQDSWHNCMKQQRLHLSKDTFRLMRVVDNQTVEFFYREAVKLGEDKSIEWMKLSDLSALVNDEEEAE